MNRKVKILLWLLVLLTICCQRKKVTDKFVIIENYNEKFLEYSTKYAPYDYYMGNNIILPEKSEKIYYHDTKLTYGTGWKVSNPPIPIDFQMNPLFQFNSVDEFSRFLKNHTSTPRLVIFISDSDTIRNKNYFDLIDILQEFERTYVVARRKITKDEFDAITNSRIISIDMEKDCNFDDLSVIQYKLMKNDNYEDYLHRFFELSKKHCQYYFDYEILYKELLYQLIIKAPRKFLNLCDTINDTEKMNISLALQGAILVEDSIIIEAYNLLQQTDNFSKKWVLENIESRMEYIIK